MAPTRSKKRKSDELHSSVDATNFPASSLQSVATKSHTPNRTPNARSPIKKPTRGITLNQKQALIDNLQLEITERARKLRAQYNLQAQGLRTRIEIRINRIPMALRKANMGDLVEKYSESAPSQQKSVIETSATVGSKAGLSFRNAAQETHVQGVRQPLKRQSDEMTDKENENLENPKKRMEAPVVHPRTTSRAKPQPDQVLSPRSANSRTVPRSPGRPVGSPGKSYLARPVSPLKPMAPAPAGGAAGILTNMVEKTTSTRATGTRKITATQTPVSVAGAGRSRKVGTAPASKVGKGRASVSSDTSNASSVATVVTKVAAGKPLPKKRLMMSVIEGISGAAGKNAAAAKAAPTRVLRKRN